VVRASVGAIEFALSINRRCARERFNFALKGGPDELSLLQLAVKRHNLKIV